MFERKRDVTRSVDCKFLKRVVICGVGFVGCVVHYEKGKGGRASGGGYYFCC